MEEYLTIVHPISKNRISIFSSPGRNLLKSYLQTYKSGGQEGDFFAQMGIDVEAEAKKRQIQKAANDARKYVVGATINYYPISNDGDTVFPGEIIKKKDGLYDLQMDETFIEAANQNKEEKGFENDDGRVYNVNEEKMTLRHVGGMRKGSYVGTKPATGKEAEEIKKEQAERRAKKAAENDEMKRIWEEAGKRFDCEGNEEAPTGNKYDAETGQCRPPVPSKPKKDDN